MTDITQFDPTSDLVSFYGSRNDRATSRDWFVDAGARLLNTLGIMSVFSGAGSDPTGLTGYAINKIWLRQSSGATTSPGALYVYKGTGSASDAANWLPLNAQRFSNYMRALQPALTANESINPEDPAFGAVADGTTDDATAVQAAIDYAASSGIRDVILTGTYAIGTTIVLPSRVRLIGRGDPELNWIGSAGGVIVDTASTGVSSEIVINGVDFAVGGGAGAIKLRSGFQCMIANVHATASNSAAIILDMCVNTSGTTNADGNRNCAHNAVTSLSFDGTAGTLIRLQGSGPTGGPASAVVTLNTFTDIEGSYLYSRGYDFAEWCDNNFFIGSQRVGILGNNSVGAEFSTVDPTGNRGVYTNNFDQLAVDTFSTYTGRVAVKLNWCKLVAINFLFNEPVAEGGAIVASSYALSYAIRRAVGGTNDMELVTRGLKRASGEHFTSGALITLANNAATSFSIDNPTSVAENLFCIVVVSSDDVNLSGMVAVKCRKSSGPATSLLLSTSSYLVASTGAHTGSTGTLTKLTIAAHNDGKVYIENRTGAALNISVALLAHGQAA